MASRSDQKLRATQSFLYQPFVWQIGVPLLLVCVTLILGTCGFLEHHQRNAGEAIQIVEAFYLAAGLPLLETTSVPQPGDHIPWTLQLARGLGLLVPPYAVFVVIAVTFREPLRRLRVWYWRATGKPYVVLCGLGWQGHELARDLNEQKLRTVIIEKNGGNPFICSVQGRWTITFVGDATSSRVLQSVQAGGAHKVFVLAGNDEVNCRIVNQLAATISSKRNGASVRSRDRLIKRCFANVEDLRMRDFLANSMRDQGVDVVCFSIWETTARALLSRWPVCRLGVSPASPLSGIHVIIMGDTPMAKAILRQILRTGHYLPEQARTITIFVRDPTGYEAELRRQFPCLAGDAFPHFPKYQRLRDEVFPTLRFAELPESDADLLDDECALFDSMKANCLTSIFVCLDDGMLGEAYVAALHPKLETLRQQHSAPCQVFSYFDYPEEQPPLRENSMQQDANHARLVHLISFGTFLDRCSVEAVEGGDLDRLAMEVQAHYLQDFGKEQIRAALQNAGDSQRRMLLRDDWRQVNEWDRESNRQAADHIAVKLHCINTRLVSRWGEMPVFDAEDVRQRLTHEETLSQLANMEHRRWCAERLLGGWRPLEPTQNRQRWNAEAQSRKAQKQHIDLIPFSDLSVEEQKKDYSQIKAIPAILERAAAR